MQMQIRPRTKEDRGGYACLPLRANVPQGHPDWKLTTCPECGAECWETPLFLEVKKSGVKGLCTFCALKKGL